MTGERVHRTSHSVEVDAPASAVFGLISDATRWPLFFPENVHVERLEFDGTNERLRMWATAGGRLRSWISNGSRIPGPGASSSARPTPSCP